MPFPCKHVWVTRFPSAFFPYLFKKIVAWIWLKFLETLGRIQKAWLVARSCVWGGGTPSPPGEGSGFPPKKWFSTRNAVFWWTLSGIFCPYCRQKNLNFQPEVVIWWTLKILCTLGLVDLQVYSNVNVLMPRFKCLTWQGLLRDIAMVLDVRRHFCCRLLGGGI